MQYKVIANESSNAREIVYSHITIMPMDDSGKLVRGAVAEAGFDAAYRDMFGKRFYFHRLKVDAAMRGSGVGSALVRALQTSAAERGLGIWCDPNPYDGPDKLDALLRFYKRHNFVLHADGHLTWDSK